MGRIPWKQIISACRWSKIPLNASLNVHHLLDAKLTFENMSLKIWYLRIILRESANSVLSSKRSNLCSYFSERSYNVPSQYSHAGLSPLARQCCLRRSPLPQPLPNNKLFSASDAQAPWVAYAVQGPTTPEGTCKEAPEREYAIRYSQAKLINMAA